MRPIKDHVLIEPIKEEKLIDLDDVKKGKVIAVGEEVKYIKLEDVVRYQYGRKVDDYILLNENDVLVVE